MAKTNHAWRNGSYVSCLTGKAVSVITRNGRICDANYAEKGKERRPHFRECDKFIIYDPETGKKECAIVFANGKIFVGADVWRMSNTSDICEYPFRQISEWELETKYERQYPVCAFLSEDSRRGKNRCERRYA